MRMILNARFPHEPFNTGVKKGWVGEKLMQYIEDTKPEAVYFTEVDGFRTAVMVVDLDSPTQMPFYAEPLFLMFNADVEFHPAMTPGDLREAGLDALGKKWS